MGTQQFNETSPTLVTQPVGFSGGAADETIGIQIPYPRRVDTLIAQHLETEAILLWIGFKAPDSSNLYMWAVTLPLSDGNVPSVTDVLAGAPTPLQAGFAMPPNWLLQATVFSSTVPDGHFLNVLETGGLLS